MITEPISVDEEFIRSAFDLFKNGERRSLIATIDGWLSMSTVSTPAVLINTDGLFPKFSSLDPKVANLVPEIYACIDQLLIALTYAASRLHIASQGQEDPSEKTRVIAVAEIIKCIATHVYSIRVLSMTGFDVQVRQIVRTYIEYLELLALVCADSAALDAFIESGNSDQANDFWHRYLSKSKARKKRLLNSVLKKGLPTETQQQTQQWHERELRLLSESAHPTVASVLRSGRVCDDPAITPEDYEAVIGSLIYTFSAFADTLEVETLDFLRVRLSNEPREESGEPDVCNRFYLIMMLSVMLGYRKEFVLFGKSDIQEDLDVALRNQNFEGEKPAS